MAVRKVTEALPKKDLSLGDRKNMVFMGTVVVSGKGRMVVTQTGLETELGKIASMLQQGSEEKTPLQVRLEELGRRLVYFCLGIVAVVFALGLWRGMAFIEILLTALSLAVAALVLQPRVIYSPPLQKVFGTVSLGKTDWGGDPRGHFSGLVFNQRDK